MDFNAIWQQIQSEAVKYGLLVVGAIVIWIVGRWVIAFVVRMLRRMLTAKHVDVTLQQYIASIAGVALNILLVIAILAQFGVETTSFAAIIASAGFAIGMAWGGLLANFAAGAFLLVLRPFKVGDFIIAAGVTGTVEEIGLFATTMITPDGIKAFVGNNKLFGDNIMNLSEAEFRRVERTMQLAHGVNVDDTINRLKHALTQTPGVLQTPPPEVWVIDFNLAGPVLAVRPFCQSSDYWSVFGATNDAIRAVASQADLPAPEMRYAFRNTAEQ